ncbi:MAG: tyrosine-type recombinase/integrase, partial [Candidatus Kariarchaeaceae archaeon]
MPKLTTYFQDFILSRKAMLCSQATIEFYNYTAGKWIEWLGKKEPSSREVRRYLVELEERGLKPNSIHSHARAIKTFLRFAYAEGYLPLIQVDLPIVPEILPEILSTDDIRRVLRACRRTRDRVIVMMLLDTGMRRGEL